MARIKIQFPEPAIFETELSIRMDDINYGGHVGNDRYLTIAQEARLRFFNALGYKNELNIEPDTGIIVTDASLTYQSELFYRDTLMVKIAIANRNKYGFDMYYQLVNTANNKIAATVKTGIISFNYNLRKVVAFPESFYLRLEK